MVSISTTRKVHALFTATNQDTIMVARGIMLVGPVGFHLMVCPHAVDQYLSIEESIRITRE